jgi:hypothetical protein
MVEFSLVVGLALAIIVGLMAASFLFFQRAAMHDGSTAGARMAAMETSLAVGPALGPWCESGSPISIEQAVATAAPQLNVNMSQLCSATSAGPLVQTNDSSKVNISVAASNLQAPGPNGTVAVTLTFSAQGLGYPLRSIFAMTSVSTVPTRSP